MPCEWRNDVADPESRSQLVVVAAAQLIFAPHRQEQRVSDGIGAAAAAAAAVLRVVVVLSPS